MPRYRNSSSDGIKRRELSIPAVYGNTSGLKGSQIKALERLYRRRISPHAALTAELARQMAELSVSTGRQIGVLAARDGAVTHVIAGDSRGIFIPSLEGFALGRKALRGLRLIHTHLKNEALTKDDLTDLALLRLDMVLAVGVREGRPEDLYAAHLMPEGSESPFVLLHERDASEIVPDFGEFVVSLEKEMERRRVFDQSDKREKAVLVHASKNPPHIQEDSIEELRELALSSDIFVVDAVIQRLKETDPKYLMGEGKLKEMIIGAMAKGVTLLVFDQDLSPSQMKSIAELTELKVIDRSQLILDIFARRAKSRDGKVQVELAQLRYRLPKLTGKGTAMSRLMGGIGGRGPGETKLEVDRRRVRERIGLLERELRGLGEARKQRKKKRVETGIPIVSIIGYTNAGKSSLLNALTKSSTSTGEKMFATLDTATRRLRFPRERDVIITDTVGFIRDLPEDLMAAFRTSLEELEDADLLLHLVDVSDPKFQAQMESVEKILGELGLLEKQRMIVFNKADRMPARDVSNISERHGSPAVSALDPSTFGPLLKALKERLWGD